MLFCIKGLSQKAVISGTINSIQKEKLLGAVIIIKSLDLTKTLAYTTSNDQGEFKISIDSNQPSFNLSVSFIGFKKWSRTIANKSAEFPITLEESVEKLDEVLLELKPIEKKGDTLNYSISSFKEQEDRVIADVIKKLPGIEVQPTGQILYQGKPIQKYFINGLDLLEGRYDLANNSLSVESVSKVQIIENHQPIKV